MRSAAPAAEAALGLYPAADFRLTGGRCADCPTIAQALWYFEREVIAVPRSGRPVASPAAGITAIDDVRRWAEVHGDDAPIEYPPLVWVAAPDSLSCARFRADASTLEHPGGTLPFSLVPKIPLNRSYFDASSFDFFGQRSAKLRGHLRDGTFVARTLWPEDFRLDLGSFNSAGCHEFSTVEGIRSLVQAEPFGGARSPFAQRVLWQRTAQSLRAERAVLGFMLNGAQGDDDEAHGGHFALVTGRTREDGAIDDWLVNNFYPLDTESEKGILGAPVPLDNYLADLNSGQNWYRPSYLIIAVLASDDAAALVQGALNRVYNHYWRHQLLYRHATMNCAGISIDVLRTLGWSVPARGPAGRISSAIGFPYFVIHERSIAKAKIAFDYLTQDQTRLMPAATFEETCASLCALTSGVAQSRSSGRLAQMVAEDTEAIVFMRFPQFPSSRAFGDAPAVTPWEVHARVPADPSARKIIPVPQRPFPDALRQQDLVTPPREPSDYAALAWGVTLAIGVGALLYALASQWR